MPTEPSGVRVMTVRHSNLILSTERCTLKAESKIFTVHESCVLHNTCSKGNAEPIAGGVTNHHDPA